MQNCSRCETDKAESDFHLDKSRPSGLSFYCKSCIRLKDRLYNETFRAKKSSYNKKYKDGHKHEVALKQRDYYLRNRENLKSSARAYYHNNREKVLERERAKTYGVSVNDLRSFLLKFRSGGCSSCHQSFTESGYDKEAIDHDHETGEIRGLLHSGCNIALGFLKESPERCDALTRYIKEKCKEKA